MKRFFAALSVMAALVVAPAFAQSKPGVRANIPFSFVAGRATLPAGLYDIREGMNPETLLIKAVNSKDAAFVITNSTATPESLDDAALVFRGGAETRQHQAGKHRSEHREAIHGYLAHQRVVEFLRSATFYRLTTALARVRAGWGSS